MVRKQAHLYSFYKSSAIKQGRIIHKGEAQIRQKNINKHRKLKYLTIIYKKKNRLF